MSQPDRTYECVECGERLLRCEVCGRLLHPSEPRHRDYRGQVCAGLARTEGVDPIG